MKKNQTKAVCPNCGAELNITVEESHTCSQPSKVVSAETPRKNKAQLRLEALRKAGRSTDGFFAMTDINGDGMLVRLVNGVPTPVADNDPILRGIYISGNVPARELFRRWIPAHMLEALSYKGYNGKEGYTDWLKNHGYEYQWQAILQELKFQAGCQMHGDDENFRFSNQFLNISVVIYAIEDDIKAALKYVSGLEMHRCRGRKYKKVAGFGKGVFLDEIDTRIFNPMHKALALIRKAKNALDLYRLVKHYCDVRINLPYNTPMCKDWMDAYKAIGAFYTLRDFILFENCFIYPDATHKLVSRSWQRVNGNPLDANQSLRKLKDYAIECSINHEGYKLLGMLKEFLECNGIDIKAKRKEWHQQTLARRAEK